ncbi:hypothetical protein PROFUN_11125 [Planoprotostelium fungivorum]|uniref:Uncharacterized protein n=1 Tax=Planoprotostelium fungivorum TaxID=1890364 RepID=A0A2P6NAR7_9EUKA|nr:hypothetical protein PROFUN_11125 [Planoprotostelium fungivorum]
MSEGEPLEHSPLSVVLQWIDDMWSQEIENSSRRNESSIIKPETSIEPFKLLQPLKIKQRKSYEGDSRFLLPKPVIVLDRSSPLTEDLVRCTVTVKLLDETGTVLDSDEQKHLVSPNGEEVVLYIPHCRTPPISLKLSRKIDFEKLCLGFFVEYVNKEGEVNYVCLRSNTFDLVRDRVSRRKQASLEPIENVNMT